MASLSHVTVTVTVTVLLFTVALAVASSAQPDPDSTKPTLPGSDEITIPVNFVNFHPINRHFPRRPLTTTAPFKRRPCHHELWGRGLQISYGNDMIFSGEEEKAASTEDNIPAIKILVGSFVSEEDDGSEKVTVNLVKRKEEDERDYYKKGQFKRKIRKFLNHLV